MGALKLKSCNYLNSESNIHLGVLHKTNRIWTLRRVVKADSHVFDQSESGPFVINDYFL